MDDAQKRRVAVAFWHDKIGHAFGQMRDTFGGRFKESVLVLYIALRHSCKRDILWYGQL